jgi:hypothetical protein
MEPIEFTSIWATKDDGVWIAGRAGVRHWNGEVWTRHQPDDGLVFKGIWAPAPSDVWVVGSNRFSRPRPTLWHWDGAAWSPHEVRGAPQRLDLRCIWGSAPDDAWAAAYGGELVRWDGRSWSLFARVEETVRAISGRGRDDVWAVGPFGVIRWDGRSWAPVAEVGEGPFVDVWADASAGVWAVHEDQRRVLRWLEDRWEPIEQPVDVTAVGGASNGHVWLGGHGQMLRWDGRAWSEERVGDGGSFVELTDADGDPYVAAWFAIEDIADAGDGAWAIGNRLCHSLWSTGEWWEGAVFRRDEGGVWQAQGA